MVKAYYGKEEPEERKNVKKNEKRWIRSGQVLIFTNKNSIVIAISKMLHKKNLFLKKRWKFFVGFLGFFEDGLRNGMIINHNLCVLLSLTPKKKSERLQLEIPR